MRGEVAKRHGVGWDEVRDLPAETFRETSAAVFAHDCRMWESNYRELPFVPEEFARRLHDEHGEVAEAVLAQVFEGCDVSAIDRTHVERILIATRTREGFWREQCGLVFAGFGDADAFSSLVHLWVDSICCGFLTFVVKAHEAVTFERSSMIFPFAQTSVVDTFILGLDPEILNVEIYRRIGDAMTSQPDAARALEATMNAIWSHIRDKYQQPVLRAITALPKLEVAAMAEAFVNLTALRQRVAMQTETVGGATDVALISKGDGFVWVKGRNGGTMHR